MKQKLIALTTACALSLGTIALVNAEGPGGPRHGGKSRHHWDGHHLDGLTEDLNLSADQKAKVQPIIDQTKPQIRSIHEDARQKTKAVMDNTMAQIRPLLTAEQQKKFDALQKAHEGLRAARKAMRDVKRQ
jgi:Spy/CpxP family protein refolding chaperone